MRITIETTVYEPQYASKVIKEVPYDDLDLDSIFDLAIDAIYGMGYHNIEEYLEERCETIHTPKKKTK